MSTEYMIYFPLVLLDWILISQLLMLAVNAAVTMFKDYTNNKLGRFNGLFIFTFVFGAMRFFFIRVIVHNKTNTWVFAILSGFFDDNF